MTSALSSQVSPGTSCNKTHLADELSERVPFHRLAVLRKEGHERNLAEWRLMRVR